ncbi:MAG: hypothetical protein SO424_02700 [[Pasteurella] aerogenes]|nr:hypothetical protein [[Pasteurella] aerogenes]
MQKKLIEQAIQDNWEIEDKKYIYDLLDPSNANSISQEKFTDVDKLIKPKDKKSAAGLFRKLLNSLVDK